MLTPLQKTWLLAPSSSDPVLFLLTLSSPETGFVRLVLNTADVTSRGETFRAAYFEIDWISDTDAPPRARLTIPNVNQEVGRIAARITGNPEVLIEAVAASSPDDVIAAARRLELRGITLSALSVSGDLARRDWGTEQTGTIRVLPSNFPALFARRVS